MEKNIDFKIQGLRAMAFLLIFFSHTDMFVNNRGTNVLGKAGAFGVEIFIFLSGYLAINNGEQKFDLGRIKRKLAKIYPLHIIMIVLTLPLQFELSLNGFLRLICNLSLFHGFIPLESYYFSFNWVSWYLSLYLLVIVVSPIMVKIYSQLTVNKVLILVIGLILFEMTLPFWTESYWLVYISPITRMSDLLIGGG